MAGEGPLKTLRGVRDGPSGNQRAPGREEPQRTQSAHRAGGPGRAGGREGGTVNIADDCISHEERHRAHHTGKGKSDNRTPTHTCTHECTHAHTTHMHTRACTHTGDEFLCLQKVRDPDWLAHHLNIFPAMVRCCHSYKEKASCVVGSALPPRVPWCVCHRPARRPTAPRTSAGPGSALAWDTARVSGSWVSSPTAP